jgi:hypothetical protein
MKIVGFAPWQGVRSGSFSTGSVGGRRLVDVRFAPLAVEAAR